jgi:hypothetical protein
MDGGPMCSIRTGDVNFILTRATTLEHAVVKDAFNLQQKHNANSTTEIPKAALMDFAKLNNIDLKYLGQ